MHDATFPSFPPYDPTPTLLILRPLLPLGGPFPPLPRQTCHIRAFIKQTFAQVSHLTHYLTGPFDQPKFFPVSALTFLVWDIFITLDQEAEAVWSFVSFFFFLLHLLIFVQEA
jgi:hypothetical protein